MITNLKLWLLIGDDGSIWLWQKKAKFIFLTYYIVHQFFQVDILLSMFSKLFLPKEEGFLPILEVVVFPVLSDRWVYF